MMSGHSNGSSTLDARIGRVGDSVLVTGNTKIATERNFGVDSVVAREVPAG